MTSNRLSLQTAAESSVAAPERVFSPLGLSVPRLVVEQTTTRPGSSSGSSGAGRGAAVGARRAPEPRELEPRATLLHAVTRTGSAQVRTEDLHERVRLPRSGTRYLFVVDSSGSHAVQERMRLVKGAVTGLLEARPGIATKWWSSCAAVGRHMSWSSRRPSWRSRRALEYMPTGGRTPLAHALELAATYVTDASVVVLVTDGHANVRQQERRSVGGRAGRRRRHSLPLSRHRFRERPGPDRPASTPGRVDGRHVRAPRDLDQTSVLHIVRNMS